MCQESLFNVYEVHPSILSKSFYQEHLDLPVPLFRILDYIILRLRPFIGKRFWLSQTEDIDINSILTFTNTDLHLTSKATMKYPSKPSEYAAQPVPTCGEFEQLWAAWDLVTRHMIPDQELLSKPIKLRNCCLFYLGHIPAFLDIHLTRATGEAPTQPAFYHQIFERGIDPDVDNPENCHAHSEIPDEWPPTEEILAYQARVRARARSLYQNKVVEANRKIGRAMWIGFEHEGELSYYKLR